MNETLGLTIQDELSQVTVKEVEAMISRKEYPNHEFGYFICVSCGTIGVGVDTESRFDRFTETQIESFTSEIIDFEDEDSNLIEVDLSACEEMVYSLIEQKRSL
jgi:hypothetical protein